MTTDHADLRAVLEALPADIQWEPNCGRIELRAPYGLSHAQMDDLMSWLLRAPALVRALLEERDDLAEQLAARPRADVYITAASHNEAMRALEQERDALRNEVKMWRSTADSLKADRDQLAKRIEDQSDAPEWLSAVDEALGEDRKKAPFIDDAVKLLRKERDAILAENRRLRETNNCLKAERDALKAEVERLRAKPVTPEQLFSSSKVIWEGWVRARDTEQGCVLDLFNYRVDRSRYVRVVEAEQPQKPVHPKWPADPVEPANPAEPITDELRLRCELAGRLVPEWVVEGHFNDHNVSRAEVAHVVHAIATSLLAEGRRRMAAEREGKP